ncbi:MAG TPA: ABC transporter ATP-binding protein [Candidatus Eisenbacteria bacterium]|nr:ABC transporter ATP-binding protein [Candidatus Eisenbacteria bacterium]
MSPARAGAVGTGAGARLRGISKTYPAAGEDVHALRDIDLDVAPGEIVALLGRSGSGKTTLLNILGTLDRPTSGSIEIAGRRVDGLDESELLRLRRESLGFVFQFFHLLPYLSALENAVLPLWLAGHHGPEAALRARELLARVGLSDKADRPAGRLSGGEMQRVAVARALVNEPALILADEPTGNLDQANAETVLDLLRGLVREQGVTLVLATHSEAAAASADRRVRLLDGRIVGID